MKALLLGATGQTGIEITKTLLNRNHSVVAIVRNKSKLLSLLNNTNIQSLKIYERAQITSSDLEMASFSESETKPDALISALGHTKGTAADFMTTVGIQICQFATSTPVRRIITISGSALPDAADKPGVIDRIYSPLVRRLLGNVFLDSAKQTRMIIETDCDWTVVRPGLLVNSDTHRKVSAGNLGTFGSFSTGMGLVISRADLANFIVHECFEKQKFIKEMPAVGYS